MYQAIVCRVGALQPIQGADRIKLATVVGHQVIVSAQTQTGDLGVFFPADGALSDRFCREAKLYRKDPLTNEVIGGYLEANRRIRTLRMKGERSEGLWMPCTALSWVNADAQLTEGFAFTHLADQLICEKYYSPATRNLTGPKQGGRPMKVRRIQLAEHYDTPQLRYNIGRIPAQAKLHFTEKLHGTSGRTGLVLAESPLGWLKTLWNRWAGLVGLPSFPTQEYVYASGTRRVTLDPDFAEDKGYYVGSMFRKITHNQIVQRGLRKGESLYYEIVGFDENGKGIMPSHTLDPKEQAGWIKRLGTDQVVYRYGCVHPQDLASPEEAWDKSFRVFVYRITLANHDGHLVELTWDQVKSRCSELGLNHVPEIAEARLFFPEIRELTDLSAIGPEALQAVCRSIADGVSTLDSSHIREGVCVIVEGQTMHRTLKFKGWEFSHCEGLKKNDDRYVDPEEIA